MAIVMILANVIAGLFHYYLGRGGYEELSKMHYEHNFIWTLIFVPFYFATEFLPILMFGYVLKIKHDI